MDNTDEAHKVWIDYENHRRVRRWRQIIPQRSAPSFGATKWHPEPQWTFPALDVTPESFSGVPPKGLRSFAVKDIHAWQVEEPPTRG